MQSIELIRSLWAADSSLSGTIPLQRVTTGRTTVRSLPRAVIVPHGSQPSLLTNRGNDFISEHYRLQVVTDRYDTLADMIDAVRRVYIGTHEDADAEQSCSMRSETSSVTQNENQQWTAEIQIEVKRFTVP